MPTLKYYVAERVNPITRSKIFFAQKVTYSNIGEREVVDYAVQNSNIERSVLEQVMIGLEEAVNNFLLNGHNLQLWPLGSFFTTISSRSAESRDAFIASNIKGVNIRFVPSPMLREECTPQKMSFMQAKQYDPTLNAGEDEEGGL